LIKTVDGENGGNGSINDEFINQGLWIGSKKADLLNGGTLTLLLCAQQFYALIVKRAIHTVRNKSLILSQLVVPIVILLINLVYLKYAPIKAEDSPALAMTISSYADNYVPFQVKDPQSEDLVRLGDLFKYKLELSSNTKAFRLENKTAVSLCGDRRDNVNDFISCVGRISFNYIIDNYIVAADFNLTENGNLSALGYFNNQPFHVPPLALNTLTNSLYNFYSKTTNKSITVTNHPLPRNFEDKINDSQTKDNTGFNIASGLSFGFSFLIASFAMFLVKERSSNSKHLQYLSGCNSYIFWISAFVWDILNYFITITIVIIFLFVSLNSQYTNKTI
jgi:ATP-binding cassette subfamily A (ABC1) protein 3